MLCRFRKRTYLIKINKAFLILCLFFFCLCCVLGVWQLHRFQYKKILLQTYQQRLHELPKPFSLISRSNDDVQFHAVAVEGEYVNALTVLIQNRFYQGKPGFEVFTPLRIAGENRLLMVDRGWVEKPNDSLPTITEVVGEQNLIGYIKRVDEYQFILGKNILQPESRPLILQKMDITELKSMTQQDYYPYVLRLDPSVANGFVRDWIISATPPERHRMYAIQWFVLALVLLIAYIGFSTELVREAHHAES